MSGEFVDIDVVSRAQGCLLGQLDGEGTLWEAWLVHYCPIRAIATWVVGRLIP